MNPSQSFLTLSASSSPSIPVFQGDYFSEWRDAMILKLNHERHYLHLQENKPMEPTEGTKSLEKYQDWLKTDGQIKSCILMHLDPSLRSPFLQLDTAKLVWEKILDAYLPSPATELLSSIRLLPTKKLSSCEPIQLQQHMDSLQQHLEKINNFILYLHLIN